MRRMQGFGVSQADAALPAAIGRGLRCVSTLNTTSSHGVGTASGSLLMLGAVTVLCSSMRYYRLSKARQPVLESTQPLRKPQAAGLR